MRIYTIKHFRHLLTAIREQQIIDVLLPVSHILFPIVYIMFPVIYILFSGQRNSLTQNTGLNVVLVLVSDQVMNNNECNFPYTIHK